MRGLEALNRIGNMPTQNNIGLVMINTLRDYGIIEKELKDKEKFEELVNMDLDLFMKAVDIKGLIEDYQKFKKALEIIITKRLNIDEIYHKDYEWYLLDHKDDDSELIPSKEEYELLKEVLL